MIKMEHFSVLMSIYDREKPEYARECFESLLRQTVPADEWVVVEDGPLTPGLYSLLDEYQEKNPGLIRRIPLSENRGLGLALRAGVPECTFGLIARMDTDDIAREDRFEKELAEFEARPELDIVGSHILEFEGDRSNVISRRSVPLTHSGIVKYQKRRSAFNHGTVMFRKEAVLRAGNYEDCPLLEDDMLWVRMIMSGAYCANIDDCLVLFRTGRDMIVRRGGLDYFKKYRQGRKMILGTGFIGKRDYVFTCALQFIVAVLPGRTRRLLYKLFLRKKPGPQ